MQKNPLKYFWDIRRKELPFAANMFSYFFLTISSFWILKPLKKSLFITYYDRTGGITILTQHLRGSQAELLAKVLNMIVAAFAVTAFSMLARRFRREQVTFILTAFFMAAYAGYSMFLSDPGEWTVWTFYLYGDLFTTLMVAGFFAFLNDSVKTDAAKRLYGIIGLGGVAGGVFGSTFLRIWLGEITRGAWMWVCFAMGAIILVNAWFAGRWVRKHGEESGLTRKDGDGDLKESVKNDNPALAGAKLTFTSRYLLSIVAIVGMYEIVSTIMDFQFTATIEHYLSGEAIGKQFSTIYMITNWVSMFVQLFLTSFIMTRFGMVAALLVLPAAALTGSVAFMAFPLLWIGSFLNTADNGFAYSINQSAKEALYVPTTVDEKYKAKAFIDMFIQRFAKVLAIGVSLVITKMFAAFSTMRWLSLITIVVALVWMRYAHYAGRTMPEKHEEDKEMNRQSPVENAGA